MRSLAFNIAYWVLSVLYALAAAFAALAPGRGAVGWIIRRYVRRMVQAMALFAGIRIEARGRERLPDGAFILAAKHQSWGDGFSIYDQFDDLAFVTGDHLERFPLLSTVLRKLGAIVVNNCGGDEARRTGRAGASRHFPGATEQRSAGNSAIAPASGTCTATPACRWSRWPRPWGCSGRRSRPASRPAGR